MAVRLMMIGRELKWLLKAEPESRVVCGVDVRFSISDLRAAQRSAWDGVRNFEARNHLRRMRVGDECLFYHSNCRTPGVAGLARVVEAATPDAAAFDASHPYFDQKSDAANPRWFAVTVEFVAEFERLIPLKELQGYAELKDMALIKRGRLSVQPVRDCEFDFIRSLAALKDE
ncbi:the Duf55 domain of thymocyte nuclear protein 1 [Obelidium mucronatum]|nr:the Duf55 domain of thymocyte nuclear protein 1 [Obelidium mucronatum]